MESRNGVLRDGVPRFRAAAIAGGAILTLDALWLVFGFGGAWATNARSDVVDCRTPPGSITRFSRPATS